MARRHPIGLGQATKLCQMTAAKRYLFLDEGMPIILDSAEGFWNGALLLKAHRREAEVLEGFAREEAAKILILVDMMRCPKQAQAQQVRTSITWFYSHLARLLYADAVAWRPTDKAEQRAYIDRHRRSHEVDGPVGEYILPAGPVHDREQRLYADVEAFEGGEPLWNAPRRGDEHVSAWWLKSPPPALRLTQAMRRLGLLTARGLELTAEVWGEENLTDDLTYYNRIALTKELLLRLQDAELIQEDAKQEDVGLLYHDWPFPMFDFDLSPIIVSLEELEAERDANLWYEMGEP